MMNNSQQDTTSKSIANGETTPLLSVVPARRFIPGHEFEFLEAIERFMLFSMRLLTSNVTAVASAASKILAKRVSRVSISSYIRDDTSKNSPDRTLHRGNSEDFTVGELDGIVDSMSYVLDVMGHYKKAVGQAASDLVYSAPAVGNKKSDQEEQDLPAGLKEMDQKNESWSLTGAILGETSPADLLLGSLMPMNSIDEYPEGSTPINTTRIPSCGPTTDAFIGSLSSLLNGETKESEDRHLGAKLTLLNNMESVSAACTKQVDELDAVLSIKCSDSFDSAIISGTSSVVTKKAGNSRHRFSKRNEGNSSSNNNSTRNAKPDVTSYLQVARDKVSKYAELATSVMQDEIKCVVSQYACGDEKESSPPPCFRPLQEHFMSREYDLDFRTYINTESDDPMKQKLLETIHSLPFLKNVGTRCQPEVRKQIGKELSNYLCDAILDGLQAGPGGRITEWGSLLLGRHVRALHAYVYEFSRCEGNSEDLLTKLTGPCLKVPAMTQKWKDVFEILNVLALEELKDLRVHKFESALSPKLVYTILNLRSEFPQDEIKAVMRETFVAC